jgi:glycine cleavage system aminomethyltransferase T
MQKIRSYLAIIVLLATLGGSVLSGMGLVVSMASSHYIGSSVASGHVAKQIADDCPGAEGGDC